LSDRNNKPFFTFNNAKLTKYISISEMPEHVKNSVIASEDKNFYQNPGFSLKGILRAALVNLKAGKIIEGGSTISQGLVKNTLLSPSRNFVRKFQEIILAIEVNRRYSKNDILEMYLNSVYFGEGAIGIENAAETYFGIQAKNLNLAQSALLVGLLPAPSSLSPLSNEQSKAKEKQRSYCPKW